MYPFALADKADDYEDDLEMEKQDNGNGKGRRVEDGQEEDDGGMEVNQMQSLI